MNNRQKAVDIFMAGVESVMPVHLIRSNVSINEHELKIVEITCNLKELKNIYVVGAGKASAAMAHALEMVMGNRITSGHIVTKYGHSSPLKYIEITEAGHPVPDENGLKGTQRILSIVKNAKKNDLVICLISGGGSALMADVPDGCSLSDVSALNSLLLKTGADIMEINCIRKHLSKIKGGLLSKEAFPARVVSLILSDVIGDPLESIASGPTAPDPTTFYNAIAIIDKYKIKNEIPHQLYKVLLEGIENKRQETIKESDVFLQFTSNFIIGTNSIALNASKEKARSLGYWTTIITNKLEGKVTDVAQYILETIKKKKSEQKLGKICLLYGGEPTIKVQGPGLGGRNQHLALIMADFLKSNHKITILSGGTDGSDGPTDVTGAVVDSLTSREAVHLGLKMEQFIDEYNSYAFFNKVGGYIKIGPTQTNVMDLIVILID